MDIVELYTPFTHEKARSLKTGQRVLITGTIYTARDAAHKRLVAMLDAGEPIPFALENQIIYYAGPTPPAPGKIVGSIGPTTAYRMDSFAPRLTAMGVTGTIAKGDRAPAVVDALKQYGAVHFTAIGGLGALLSKKVRAVEVVAFEDLGTEAVRKLEVEQFPVVVAIDSQGRNIYERNVV